MSDFPYDPLTCPFCGKPMQYIGATPKTARNAGSFVYKCEQCAAVKTIPSK